jgi:hypothetical protein
MNRLRTLVARLKGGRRPPTGPLTTVEQTNADELRQETLAKDNERIAREQKEKDRRELDSASVISPGSRLASERGSRPGFSRKRFSSLSPPATRGLM